MVTHCSNCGTDLFIANNHACLCPKCVEKMKAGEEVTVYAEVDYIGKRPVARHS